MKEENGELDYGQMKEKALRQLRSGESLFGSNGAFAPLLKQFLESALEGELDAHLGQNALLEVRHDILVDGEHFH